MRKNLTILLLPLFILFGCQGEEDIFQYKGAYVGDNSAVGHILNETADEVESFRLKTEQEPYGIEVFFDEVENQERLIKRQATTIFSLVQNVEWMIFHINGSETKVTRDEVNGWYERDVTNIESQKELEQLIDSRN